MLVVWHRTVGVNLSELTGYRAFIFSARKFLQDGTSKYQPEKQVETPDSNDSSEYEINQADLTATKQWLDMSVGTSLTQSELGSPVPSVASDDSLITVESDDDTSDEDSSIQTHSESESEGEMEKPKESYKLSAYASTQKYPARRNALQLI